MAKDTVKTFTVAIFMIIVLVYSPAALLPCNSARLTYQEIFDVKAAEECGPCVCCESDDTPPCCLCPCPVRPSPP
ncbi:hypothetical protein ACJIZ3_020444 [Penstemon smallii]|uniref:Transmembrane protein n=1 Tax=Penstemon smallii TaxID=265156 RepID=A0ABD3SIX2_9LAMI